MLLSFRQAPTAKTFSVRTTPSFFQTLAMVQLRSVVAVGCPHHITQGGSFHRDVFFDDEGLQICRDLLAQLGFELPVGKFRRA